jgi:AraC-like DNA-binding protein
MCHFVFSAILHPVFKCEFYVPLCDIMKSPHPVPLAVINGASVRDVVRGTNYRWHCLRRGEGPEIILQRTLAGEGRVRIGRHIHAVGEGKMFIVAVPENAEYWFDSEAAREWVFEWINLRGEWVRELWLGLRRRFGAVPTLDPDGIAAGEFSNLAHHFVAHRLQERSAQAEACYRLFVQCWLELEGGESPPPAGHAALRELIRKRYREPVNIKELCAAVGQSREHLTRSFRAAYGIEPAAWLRSLRLDAARVHLRQSSATLDEIARNVGFASGRQLTRAFHASQGMTPAAYRATLASSASMGKTGK